MKQSLCLQSRQLYNLTHAVKNFRFLFVAFFVMYYDRNFR